MGQEKDLIKEVKDIIGPTFSIRDGQNIPDSDSIGLGTEGVRMELCVLYSDIAGSTKLIRDYRDWFVAAIAKSFLVCNVRIIRAHGGVITSFDGDRIMAVFDGGSKNTNAAKCALKINYAVKKIITPRIQAAYPKQSSFVLKHCTGIDRSPILITRSGIRNNNDLVWIGQAPNYAAKLSDQRTSASSYMTADVYNWLKDDAKYGGKPSQNMWKNETVNITDKSIDCYSSTWHWKP